MLSSFGLRLREKSSSMAFRFKLLRSTCCTNYYFGSIVSNTVIPIKLVIETKITANTVCRKNMLYVCICHNNSSYVWVPSQQRQQRTLNGSRVAEWDEIRDEEMKRDAEQRWSRRQSKGNKVVWGVGGVWAITSLLQWLTTWTLLTPSLSLSLSTVNNYCQQTTYGYHCLTLLCFTIVTINQKYY